MNHHETAVRATDTSRVDARNLLSAISATARVASAGAEPLEMLRQAAQRIAAAIGWKDAGLLLVAPGERPTDHGHYAVAGDAEADMEQCVSGPRGECLVEKAVSTGSLAVATEPAGSAAAAGISDRNPRRRKIILQPVPPIPGMADAVLRFISDDEHGAAPGLSQAEHDALDACATLLGLACRLYAARDGAVGDARRRIHSLGGTVLLGVGAAGDITTWSPEAQRMFGWESLDIVGRSLAGRLLAEDSRDRFLSLLAALTSPQGTAAGRTELTALRANGTEFAAEFEFWEQRAGASLRLFVSVNDISERKKHELELENLALHDPLTGVANRAALRREIAAMLADPGSEIAVVFIDFDKFKRVNDTLGHEVGDRLLEAVAARLTSAVRPHDLVARLAGDEFVIVARCGGDPDVGRLLAERVIQAVATPVNLGGDLVDVGLSVGVTHSRPGQRDATTLLSEADAAMYAAKRDGTGIAFFGADTRSDRNKVNSAAD